MPLASSKQLAMMSLLHYLMLTLFHSRFLLPVPKLAHRLYNAAASSPSRPREGDSLAIMLQLTIRLFAPDQFYRATVDSGFALAAQPRIEIDGE